MHKSRIGIAAIAIAAQMTLPMMSFAANLGDAEFSAESATINSELVSSLAACGSLAGNANYVCMEQAKGKAKVARAELEFAHSGSPDDENKIAVVKAEADFVLAMGKCNDLAGNVKDVCVEQAKATQTKALAQAKLRQQITQAKTEATTEMVEADYKVAAEKCDAFSGPTKTDCVARAKARYGKN